jgi:signal transduction histidine kinase
VKSRYHKRLFASLTTDTMTEHDYFLAWGIYAFAAVGCLLVCVRLTRWMWRYLREPLRVLALVLVATPTIVDPIKELYAPAIAIAALDLIVKAGNNVLQAAADLAMYGMFAFALYAVFVLIRWPIQRAARARRAEQAAADERRAATLAAEQAEQDERNERRAASLNSGYRAEPRL